MATLGLLVAGCTGSADGRTIGDAEATGPTAFARDRRSPTIKVGVTGWTGTWLNVAVVESPVERRLVTR